MNAADYNRAEEQRRQSTVEGQYRERHFKVEKPQGSYEPRPVGLPSQHDGYGFLTSGPRPEIMDQDQGNGTFVRTVPDDSEA